jgi:Tol biopolymer transport system component
MAVVACLCRPIGTGFLLAGDDLAVARLEKQLRVREPKDLHGRIVVAFTPDGKGVVTGTIDRKRPASLWDAETGKELRTFEPMRWTAGFSSVAVTPDGKTLVTGAQHNEVSFWDLASGRERQLIETKGFGTSVALSPDGETLAFCEFRDTPVRLFDIRSGKETRAVEIATDGGRRVLNCLAFAPDGKHLVAAGSSVFWCDPSSGRVIRRVNHDFGVHSIAFSPDGKTVAAGSRDASVELYDAATGKRVTALKGHGTRGVLGVFAVAFSPDGRTVASAGEDGTVRLWEVLSGGERLCLKGQQKSVVSVAFAPDGTRLVSGDMDGAARIWDVSLGVADRPKNEPADEQFYQARWDRLASTEGADAFLAMCELARAPQATLKFFRERLAVPERGEAEKLVRQLDSKDFKERERASAALERMGKPAVDALRQALAAKPTAEVRRRALAILDRVETDNSRGERYRSLRILEVLEHLGTAEARELLESIAEGVPESELTQEAKASLDRLAKRGGRR